MREWTPDFARFFVDFKRITHRGTSLGVVQLAGVAGETRTGRRQGHLPVWYGRDLVSSVLVRQCGDTTFVETSNAGTPLRLPVTNPCELPPANGNVRVETSTNAQIYHFGVFNDPYCFGLHARLLGTRNSLNDDESLRTLVGYPNGQVGLNGIPDAFAFALSRLV